MRTSPREARGAGRVPNLGRDLALVGEFVYELLVDSIAGDGHELLEGRVLGVLLCGAEHEVGFGLAYARQAKAIRNALGDRGRYSVLAAVLAAVAAAAAGRYSAVAAATATATATAAAAAGRYSVLAAVATAAAATAVAAAAV